MLTLGGVKKVIEMEKKLLRINDICFYSLSEIR